MPCGRGAPSPIVNVSLGILLVTIVADYSSCCNKHIR